MVQWLLWYRFLWFLWLQHNEFHASSDDVRFCDCMWYQILLLFFFSLRGRVLTQEGSVIAVLLISVDFCNCFMARFMHSLVVFLVTNGFLTTTVSILSVFCQCYTAVIIRPAIVLLDFTESVLIPWLHSMLRFHTTLITLESVS